MSLLLLSLAVAKPVHRWHEASGVFGCVQFAFRSVLSVFGPAPRFAFAFLPAFSPSRSAIRPRPTLRRSSPGLATIQTPPHTNAPAPFGFTPMEPRFENSANHIGVQGTKTTTRFVLTPTTKWFLIHKLNDRWHNMRKRHILPQTLLGCSD